MGLKKRRVEKGSIEEGEGGGRGWVGEEWRKGWG